MSALHKALVGLFFLLLASVTSALLYMAIETGQTYCLGPRCRGDLVEAAGDPIGYWLLVAIWYSLAWLALSAGIFTLLARRR